VHHARSDVIHRQIRKRAIRGVRNNETRLGHGKGLAGRDVGSKKNLCN
jgi:hypothetical protein